MSRDILFDVGEHFRDLGYDLAFQNISIIFEGEVPVVVHI